MKKRPGMAYLEHGRVVLSSVTRFGENFSLL